MVTTKQAAILATAAAIGLGSHAAAQTIQGGWEIRVSNVVSPSQPSATVEMWAWFDEVSGVSEIFVGGTMDLVSDEGEFFDFGCPLLQAGCDPTLPRLSGSSIRDISVGQVHLPAIGIFGDPSNPILAFTGEWRTSDFSTARLVDVRSTNAHSFYVAAFQTGALLQLWPQGFVNGSGVISVVPAPGSLVGLSGVFVIGQRRRVNWNENRPLMAATGLGSSRKACHNV